MAWTRNEWLLTPNGWSRKGACVVNYPETETTMRNIMASWDTHQWIETDDLIIGIPPDDRADNYYLVAFHKEVRQ